MNLLAICQRVAQEANISGGAAAFTTTIGVVGKQRLVLDWVNSAYRDVIRERSQWAFMRSSFTVNATAGNSAFAYGACVDTNSSAPIAAFRNWIKDSILIYANALGVADQGRLPFLGYDYFRELYMIGTVVQRRPSSVTIDPQRRLVLGPVPEQTYVISGDYYKASVALAADADVPVWPEEHHELVVWRALRDYGRYEAAPEVYQDAKKKASRIMTELESDQLPPMAPGDPLA